MSLFNFFLITALCCSLSYAGNVCSQKTYVNMPFLNSGPYYFPSTWRENQTAPSLNKLQSCSWQINIQNGYYARIIVDAETYDTRTSFEILDSAGNLIETTEENQEPYFFPSPRVTINARTAADALFAFKVVWVPFPQNVQRLSYGPGATAEAFNSSNTVYSDRYDAQQVSIFPFPADPSNILSYRSVMVFEGQDLTGTYRGNLFFAAQAGGQLVSTGTHFFVINVEATPNSKDQHLVQDYQYVKNFAQYSKLYCSQNTTCTASLDGGAQKSALVAIQQVKQTLIKVDMDDDATFTIYYDSLDAFGYYKAYTGKQLKAALPVTFYDRTIQYVLSKGKANFEFVFHQ